jgi:hypothetical protein
MQDETAYQEFKARMAREMYDAIRSVPREFQVDALCEWLMLSSMGSATGERWQEHLKTTAIVCD